MNKIKTPWFGIVASTICILMLATAVVFEVGNKGYLGTAILMGIYAFSMSLGSKSKLRFIGYSGLFITVSLACYVVVYVYILTGFKD
ncbi:MAG: hypothetical protein QNK36_20835 [Colwellia sp.]|nr:hypothetical protein [Colwellia sp.]